MSRTIMLKNGRLTEKVKRLMTQTYPEIYYRYGGNVEEYATSSDGRRVVAVRVSDRHGMWSWFIHDEKWSINVSTERLRAMYGLKGRVDRLPEDATEQDILRIIAGLMVYEPPTSWDEYGRFKPGPRWIPKS